MRVLRQKRDQEGNPVGSARRNPALDTHVYEVSFPDGRTVKLAAKVIAEVIYAQCDAGGNNMSCWMPSWTTARIHLWLCP
jgi:hypothetical protein